MSHKIAAHILLLLVLPLTAPPLVQAQERPRILLIDVHAAQPADSLLVRPLVSALEERLRGLDGPVVPSIQAAGGAARSVPVNNGSDRAALDADRAHIVLSRVEGVLLRARVTVVPLKGEPFDFEVTQIQLIELADQISSNLVFRLTRRIRIGMLSFPMRRGNIDRYGGLDKSLPAMIGEGLSVSPRITLVESLSEDQLEQLKGSIPQAAGLHDQRTALTLGRRLHASYLIMGEYWELNGALRVDVRCVNVETGAVVVTRGINIEEVSVERIHREMSSLAATMRTIIENDFTPRARPRNVGITGRPPYPDNLENRRILEEILRTVSRKMRVTRHDSLRVKLPTTERFRQYLDQRADGLLVSAELEADYLFTLSLNRFDRDRLEIELFVFDALNPSESRFHRQVTSTVAQLNRHIETLTDSALAAIGVQLNDAQRAAWRQPGYRGLYQPIGFQVMMGPTLRNDASLFLGVGGGLAVDFGVTWIPFDSGHWMIQPMTLRFDFLGKRSNRTVIGGDLLFATANYRFRPHMTLNPYLGASFGYLGVFRGGSGDRGYDARLGYGLSAGIEHTFENARRFSYQVRWLRAVDEVAAQTLGQRLFPSGRPGGLFLSVGTSLF